MGASKDLFSKEREKEFLNDLHEPKSKLKEFDLFEEIQRMIERVNEGYENELEIYCLFSDAEKAFKLAKDEILPKAIEERQKYEEKTLKLYGKNISFTQSGRYDYSGWEKWNKVKNDLDNIQDLMKQSLSVFLKGGDIADENGEVVPPAKYIPSKMSLKLG